MRDQQRMRKALRAVHGAGAFGSLSLAAALCMSLPARAAENSFALPRLAGADLVRFAELCEATDGLDRPAAIQVAAGQGFRTVDAIADEAAAFYGLRDAAFAHRGEANEVMNDNPESVLLSFGHGWEAFFERSDGTLAILRADNVLAMLNGVPTGQGHVCQFLGQGWIEEPDAEAAMATLWGEDFGGRGRTFPQEDGHWRNLFTGFELGDKPHAAFTLTTVKGAPGGIPPTFTFGYVVKHDMTIPPEVLSGQ